MSQNPIALVGDYDPGITAHAAIDRCFALAGADTTQTGLRPHWIPTARVAPGDASAFRSYAGIWLVPASPYRHTAGALWSIEYARLHRLPFLGTCGGFQHALLEYARNVLGLTEADHAENNPQTSFPLLHPLACSLVEKTELIHLMPDSSLAEMYQAATATEAFHCRYGINAVYESCLFRGPLRVAARSGDGQVRAFELRDHRFFVGTLFQPERRALTGELHPIVRSFFGACLAWDGAQSPN
ncbi:MAG: gamma-glutamyl-gamma-aminobutyrate hydrolase family protein [Verrucomicrobiota bacterium]